VIRLSVGPLCGDHGEQAGPIIEVMRRCSTP